MKYLNLIFITSCLALTFMGCSDEPEASTCCDYGYEMLIHSPQKDEVISSESDLPIDILFHSTTGDYVHFVEVKIFKADDTLSVLHNLVSHVHIPDSLRYKAIESLDAQDIPSGKSNWICRTKIYGHEADPKVISQQNTFQINNP